MNDRPGPGDRWAEIDRLFAAALDRPAEERAAFLEREAAGDLEIAGAVEDLLRAEAASTGRLERHAGRSLAALRDLATRLDAPRPSTIVVGGTEAAAIAAARATTPAHLRRALKGDLDTMTRTALSPEPKHRRSGRSMFCSIGSTS